MSPAESSAIDYKALVQDDRIHASLYTDPRVFEDEMDRIFHAGWVFVGHDSEIPRAGDFVTRRLGREPVIMVRGRDGGAVAEPVVPDLTPARVSVRRRPATVALIGVSAVEVAVADLLPERPPRGAPAPRGRGR